MHATRGDGRAAVIAVGRAFLAAPLALCLAGCCHTVTDPGGYARNRTSPLMVFEDMWRRAPAMDESRRTEERDCTKPVDGVTGNLKCR